MEGDFSNIYDVAEIQFSVLSPEEIIANSVAPVLFSELNEGSSLDNPRCNSCNDPRMGPSTPHSNIVCPTDDLAFQLCPGYFGHIELAKPVFWPHWLAMVKNILRLVCYNCSRLLFDLEDPRSNHRVIVEAAQKLKGMQRFKRIRNKIATPCKTCVHCSAVQPTKISQEPAISLIAEFKNLEGGAARRVHFSAERVRLILQRITDEEIELLGLNRHYSRPEWMICTVFPVPPPAVRPSSTRADASQRSEDDLTIKLVELVKFNKELTKRLQPDHEQNQEQIEQYVQLLQVHVACFVNNDLNGIYKVMRKGSAGAVKSVMARLKGKFGRIRGNLMGKRSNYSARSVITGDPDLSVEEVGVPLQIAMNLSYPSVSFTFQLLS